MKVQAITCPECGDTIYSRAVHDWHPCSCWQEEDGKKPTGCYIDGGFDYLHYGGAKFDQLKPFQLEVEANEKALYEDWANRIDKFGLIKGEKKCRRQQSKSRK